MESKEMCVKTAIKKINCAINMIKEVNRLTALHACVSKTATINMTKVPHFTTFTN